MGKEKFKFDPFAFDDEDVFYEKEEEIKSLKKRMDDFSDERFSESSRNFDDIFDDSLFSSSRNEDSFKRYDLKETKNSNKIIFNNPFDELTNSSSDINESIEDFNVFEQKKDSKKETREKASKSSAKQSTIKTNKVDYDSVISAKNKIDHEFSIDNLEIRNTIKINKEAIEFFNDSNMSVNKVRQIVESLLYVMGKDGLELQLIEKITKVPTNVLKHLLDKMIEFKKQDNTSGLIIKQYGTKYYMLCKSEMVQEVSHIWDKTIVKTPNKLKMQVLSIIAYNQPCTKKGIESIRGKDCTNILKSLVEDGLIDKTKKPSRKTNAFFYTVTQRFLNLFNLKDLKDLPNLNNKSNKYINSHDFTVDDE